MKTTITTITRTTRTLMKFGKNQMVIINFDKKEEEEEEGDTLTITITITTITITITKEKKKKEKNFSPKEMKWNEMKIILFQVIHRLDGDGDRDGGEVDDDDGVGRWWVE